MIPPGKFRAASTYIGPDHHADFSVSQKQEAIDCIKGSSRISAIVWYYLKPPKLYVDGEWFDYDGPIECPTFKPGRKLIGAGTGLYIPKRLEPIVDALKTASDAQLSAIGLILGIKDM